MTSRIPSTKVDIFTQHWLPQANPHTAPNIFTATNPSLLKDLYPNIWHFGPRGDIYINQLNTLINLFETYATNPTAGGAFHFTNNYLPGFNMIFDLNRYTKAATRHLHANLKREHRPLDPFHVPIAIDTLLPLFDTIIRHRIFPTAADAPVRRQLHDFLKNFTYHSLHRDIHIAHKSNIWLIDYWAHYADTWHFDAM